MYSINEEIEGLEEKVFNADEMEIKKLSDDILRINVEGELKNIRGRRWQEKII